MVVLQRNEVSRNRLLYILTIILSAVILAGAAIRFSGASEAMHVLFVLLGGVALRAIFTFDLLMARSLGFSARALELYGAAQSLNERSATMERYFHQW